MLCWEGRSSLDPFCQDTDFQAAQPEDLKPGCARSFSLLFSTPSLLLYLFVLSLPFLSECPLSSFSSFFFFLIHAFRDILGREEGGEETQPHGNLPLPDSQPCSGKKQGWGRGKNHTKLKALAIHSCCFPECQGSFIWPCTRGRRTCAL